MACGKALVGTEESALGSAKILAAQLQHMAGIRLDACGVALDLC